MRLSWFFSVTLAVLLVPYCGLDAQVKEKAKEKDKDLGKSFAIPYRLTDAGHILVRAKINGQGPFNFIVDTGAPLLYVCDDAARKLNIKAAKKGSATLEEFQIEGGSAHKGFKCVIDTPFQLEGMNSLGIAGVELHGVIGYGMLAHYKMEIDLTKDRMTWTKLDFVPPAPISVGSKEDASQVDAMAKMMKALVSLVGKKGPQAPALRGFIGVDLAEKDGAVVVKSVLAKSPAEASGVAVGDRIVSAQGKEIESLEKLLESLATITSGQEVRFVVVRQAEKREIVITAGEGM